MDALGDPTRRAILERLRGGARAVGELAEGMPVSRPAVSQHLRVLEQAGLVVARKHGTRRLYRLDPDGLDELRAALDTFWSDALAAFTAAAQEEETTMTAETATLSVRKVVRVELPLERAFELFTAGVGSWWPTLTHSIHEADVAELVWEARAGGRLYEVSTSGEEADWADVLVWEPPSRFVLAWRVNPERPLTEVEVRFTDEGETTRVELEHRGWPEETARDGYDGYDKGWGVVLGRFMEAAAA